MMEDTKLTEQNMRENMALHTAHTADTSFIYVSRAATFSYWIIHPRSKQNRKKPQTTDI